MSRSCLFVTVQGFLLFQFLLQLAEFSQLRFSDGKQMVQTYRPVQPLNGRQVFYSRGHIAAVSTGLLIMAALVPVALCLHTTT